MKRIFHLAFAMFTFFFFFFCYISWGETEELEIPSWLWNAWDVKNLSIISTNYRLVIDEQNIVSISENGEENNITEDFLYYGGYQEERDNSYILEIYSENGSRSRYEFVFISKNEVRMFLNENYDYYILTPASPGDTNTL